MLLFSVVVVKGVYLFCQKCYLSQLIFRTTFTVDTRGEHAIQQMLLTHPLTNGGQISIEGYTPGR